MHAEEGLLLACAVLAHDRQHDVVGARWPEEGVHGGEDAAMQQAVIVFALRQLDVVLGGVGAEQGPPVAVGDRYVVDGG